MKFNIMKERENKQTNKSLSMQQKKKKFCRCCRSRFIYDTVTGEYLDKLRLCFICHTYPISMN